MIDRSGSAIDHLNLAVPDLAAARAFYDPVLAAIDIAVILDIPAGAFAPTDPAMTGYGWKDVKPFFWLLDSGRVGENMHLAFAVPDRAAVHTFERAALEAGGSLLHTAAVHPEYHEHYYGAFVLDPHGINVEAVCHAPA